MTPYSLLNLTSQPGRPLAWNTVRDRADLLAMRARQIERRDEDIEEAVAHLQRMREQGKEQYDRMRAVIKELPKKGDLVLLHNSKLETSHSKKLKFRWTGPYRVKEVVNEKGTYWLEGMDGTQLKLPTHGNRLK